ncbi:MAG: hypothetical protein NWR83_06070 [Salibacteraceae bacterium]|jgi:hypothetical protein|nr:hypothetical protein [Salibacteraceae bacterium]
MSTETQEPVIKEKVERKTKPEVNPEAQVIVHCTVYGMPFLAQVRVWPSTFLVCQSTGHSSKLQHAEGIVFVPQWQPILESGKATFTLIFSGLPKTCTHFNFAEVIPEAGGWLVKNIKRNAQDVYRIVLE